MNTVRALAKHEASNVSERQRFYLLDGLRGVAAVLVVLYHVPLIMRPWLPDFNGWLAVDFFFCLSGFVIAFSYEERLLSGMSLGEFLITRFIRLYPLYFLGLLLGIATTLVSARAGAVAGVTVSDVLIVSLSGILLLPNFAIHWPIPYCFPLNVPAWSLFLEIMANIAFAVGLRVRSAKTVSLIVTAGVCLGLWVRAAGGVGQNLHLGYQMPTFAVGFARVGSSFCLGALMFRLFVYLRQPQSDGKFRWGLPAIVTSSLVGILVCPFSSLRCQVAAVAIVFPATVLLGACCTLPDRWTSVCSTLGALSYPLYILHSPIIGPLTGRKMQVLLPRHGIPSIVAILIICLGLSMVAWAAAKVDAVVRRKLTRIFGRLATRETGTQYVADQLIPMEESTSR